MATEFLSDHDLPEWDAFVAQHPLGLVYHLSSWKEVLERAFKHIMGHFMVLRDKSGNIIAGMPIYLVRSWLLGNRLVSIPYAPICDPLISGFDQYQLFLPELYALQKRTSSQYLEVRVQKTANWMPMASGVTQSHLLHNYLPLDQPPEELRKRFAYTTIRRVITRAERDGLVVSQLNDESAMLTFYELLCHTRKRLCLPPMPFRLFGALTQAFGDSKLMIFAANLDRRPIAALMTLAYNKIMHFEYFGGNSQAYRMGASHLLYWEAIKHAWAVGSKIVSFGRTDSWNRGLLDFKRRWGTLEEPVGILRFGSAPKRLIADCHFAKRNMVSRLIFGHAPNLVCNALASFLYNHHG